MPETVTVTELNTRVKELFGAAPGLNDIWLVGEISNLKRYASGHYYFTIKDTGSEIRAVMFRGSRARTDFEPSDSMKVRAYGHVDMYVERGGYQFIVETMRASGIGELYERCEKLKKKLEAEGLFDAKRKRGLPRYPRTIGVVTSPAGAVIHDIITTSGRLFPADILLAPAQVQGDGAAESIVRGIELLNREGVDVIIVGRGGGSIEDLWAFNEEPVARAIAASGAPIISSVGHETDFTIADFVADVRAATPTAAAELAVRNKQEICRELEDDAVRMNKALTRIVELMRGRFAVSDSKLSPRRAQEMVGMLGTKLDSLSQRMAAALSAKAGEMHRRFSAAEARLEPSLKAMVAAERSAAEGVFARLDPSARNVVGVKRARLEKASAHLSGLDPGGVLKRGYSYVAGPDGRALTSVKDVRVGDTVTVRMRDGRADAQIKSKEETP